MKTAGLALRLLALPALSAHVQAENTNRLTAAAQKHYHAGLARQTLYQNGYLGIALLSLGRGRNDPALLREATAEFEEALQAYPNQPGIQYSLAATWSLLGDADQAAQHLGVAIDHDADGELSRRAAADPDLAAVRASPAYTAALDRRRRRLAEDQAQSSFRQALKAQQTAEHTNDLLVAGALLQQATALYQQAVDAQLYDQWSTFLMVAYYPLLKTAADQQRLLTEVRQILEGGIARARFSSLRGRLESQLGTALVLLAQLQTGLSPVAGDDGASPSGGLRSLATSSGTETNSTALYAEAIKHFQTAATAETGSRTASFYELWGIALLRVSQNSKDTMLVRQATERLLKSLDLKADNPTVHYNLACAYSQLRQPDQALRHLERSLHQDPQGLFYTNTEKDPDLEPLRRTDAFTELFRHRPKPAADGHPTVSEK